MTTWVDSWEEAKDSDSESFINGGRFSVPMPEGWRKDAVIAAEIEGKPLQQFLLDATLEAIKAAKEKKAMKAVQVLLDSGLTAEQIEEICKELRDAR